MAPKPQPSRKGKKAWRKNVDVEDINQALEAKREKEILLGEDAVDGFVIDNAGDYSVSKPKKTLKIADILTNKSKVAPLAPKTRKKVISSERAAHLMALAGRLATTSAFSAKRAQDGIDRATNKDLWLEDVQKPNLFHLPKSYTPPTKAPTTLKTPALKLHSAEFEDINLQAHAGKSYNPSSESWKALISKEYTAEEKREIEYQALKAHREKIEHLMKVLESEEVVEDAEEEEEEVYENEEDKYRLSANPRTVEKRKDRTRRNKEARRKETERLNAKLREVKQKMKDLDKLEEIQEEVNKRVDNFRPQGRRERVVMKYSKHDTTFKPLELKLSDELTNDLRSLKPEGNLFYDQLYKLQASGKIESRIPQEVRRRYKEKFVVKLTHKDFAKRR